MNVNVNSRSGGAFNVTVNTLSPSRRVSPIRHLSPRGRLDKALHKSPQRRLDFPHHSLNSRSPRRRYDERDRRDYSPSRDGHRYTDSTRHSGGNIPHQGGNIPHQRGNISSQGGHIPRQGGHIPRQGGHIPHQRDHIPRQGGNIPHSSNNGPRGDREAHWDVERRQQRPRTPPRNDRRERVTPPASPRADNRRKSVFERLGPQPQPSVSSTPSEPPIPLARDNANLLPKRHKTIGQQRAALATETELVLERDTTARSRKQHSRPQQQPKLRHQPPKQPGSKQQQPPERSSSRADVDKEITDHRKKPLVPTLLSGISPMLIPSVNAHIDAAVLAIAAPTTSSAGSPAHSINTADKGLIGNPTELTTEEEDIILGD